MSSYTYSQVCIKKCRENEQLAKREKMGQSERKRLMEEIQTHMRSREATEKVLESKTTTIQALEAELNSQSASQSPLIESMQQQLKESNHLISDLGSNVESLQKTLIEKDQDHEKLVKDKEEECMERLQTLQATMDAEVAELVDKLKAADVIRQKLESQITDYEEKTKQLEALNAQLSAISTPAVNGDTSNNRSKPNMNGKADDDNKGEEMKEMSVDAARSISNVNNNNNDNDKRTDQRKSSIDSKGGGNGLWDNLGKGLFFDRHSSLNKKRNSTHKKK